MIDWNWKFIQEERPKFIREKLDRGFKLAESDFILVEYRGQLVMAKFCKVEEYSKAREPKYYFISNAENITNDVYLWQYAIKA